MAKKEAQLKVKVTTQGEKKLKGLRGIFDKLKKNALKLGLGIAALGAAFIKLGKDSAQFDDVKTSFTNLAAQQGKDANEMLANMRKLSAGTISDLELMKKANNALLLGLPVDRFGDMLSIARSAAKATGQSMDFMLNSIVTGIGRQSKLMLDNLGIIIDMNKANENYARTLGKQASQLSDAEKKQAFLNEALKQGLNNVQKAGPQTQTLSERWQQLGALFKNVSTLVGDKLQPAFSALITVSTDALLALQKVFSAESTGRMVLEFSKRIISATNWLKELWATASNLTNKGEMAKEIRSIRRKEQIEFQKLEEEFRRSQKEANKKFSDEELAQKAEQARKQKELNARTQAAIAEQDEAKKIAKQEEERLFQEGLTLIEAEGQMTRLNQALANATSLEEQERLIEQRKLLRQKAINTQRKKEATEMFKFEQMMNSNKVKSMQSTFGQISTLQNSSSKELAAIGKAAALANITISTAQGVAKAWSLGPILGPILAPLVIAAGAAQAATVAGVKLEDGGIVSSQVGGVPAIVGEGGRDEAVVPLDDEVGGGGLGNNITINVMGGLLGDRQSAHELALAIDQELFELRKGGESRAFDEGLV